MSGSTLDLNRDAQLSTIANAVYMDVPPEKIGQWERVNQSGESASGFNGAAYVNHQTKQVVLAFRGTDHLSDLPPDITFMVGGWSEQFSEAVKFSVDVKKDHVTKPLLERMGYQLIVTGHSLGGGIAQIIASLLKLSGATFEAPGSAKVITHPKFEELRLKYASHINEGAAIDLVNYHAGQSLISATGSTVGRKVDVGSLNETGLMGYAGSVLVAAAALFRGWGGVASGVLGSIILNIDMKHSMAGMERTMHLLAGLNRAIESGAMSVGEASLGSFMESIPEGRSRFANVFVFRNGQGEVQAYVEKQGEGWMMSTVDQATTISFTPPAVAGEMPTCVVKTRNQPPYSCLIDPDGNVFPQPDVTEEESFTVDVATGETISRTGSVSSSDGREVVRREDHNGDGQWDSVSVAVQTKKDEVFDKRIYGGDTLQQLLNADRQLNTLYQTGQLGSGTWGIYTDWSTRQLLDTRPPAPNPSTCERRDYLPDFSPIGAFYESRSAQFDNAASIAESTFRLFDEQGNALDLSALQARDANRDELLDGQELQGLQAWTDLNEDGVLDRSAGAANEWHTLPQLLASQGRSKLLASSYALHVAGNAMTRSSDNIADPVNAGTAPLAQASRYAALRGGENVFVTREGPIEWAPTQVKISHDQRNLVGTDGDDAFSVEYYRPYHGRFFNLDLIDHFHGGGGNDIVGGSSRADHVWGGVGNDALLGYDGNDVLDGEDGNDELQGGAGHDTLHGGAAEDRLFGQAGNDLLSGGDGDDLLVGFKASNEAGQTLAAGESDDDRLFGGAGQDQLHGGWGNDYMVAGSGNDLMFGDDGKDVLFGDAGDDQADGGLDTDTVVGGAGADKLFGGAGNDRLWGGDGDDIMVGFTAHNQAKRTLDAGETDDDRMFGGAGLDLMLGDFGHDVMWGGAHDDELQGGAGDDALYGEEGRDRLFGGVGRDVLYGGQGDDLLVGFTGSNEHKQTLAAGEHDEDSLHGGAGDDILLGGLGDDYLDGGAGADHMEGGQGDDIYIVNSVNDVVLELAGEGDDLVVASTSYMLNAQVERLQLLAGQAINGTGNRLDNILLGNDHDNILDGVTGADRMIGGGGNDTYYVDDAGDAVVELADEGCDTVKASISHALAEHVENLQLLDFSAPEKGQADGVAILVYGYPKANELDYMQGDAVAGYRGTCALTSIANLALQGHRDMSEQQVVQRAISNGWCVTDAAATDYQRGGSNFIGQRALLDSYGMRNGMLQGYDEQAVANLVKGGRGVIIAVNAGSLWDDSAYRDLGGVNHVVTVTGVACDAATGDINGFYIADSGRGKVSDMTRYVAVADFRRHADVGNAYAIYTVEPIKLWDEDINGRGNALDNTLIGNRANNVLDGGLGNDTLVGGAGDDTYVFQRGDGQDRIIDDDHGAGGQDVLRLGEGIGRDQLWLRRQGEDLVVDILGGSDRVAIQDWYRGAHHQVEQIQFADGSALASRDVDGLVQAMAAMAPPAANDTAWAEPHRVLLALAVA